MNLKIAVYRYNPDVDTKPYMKDYTLEVAEGTDMMVLDVLMLLKEQDPTLAFRRSCREGVCGSDGVNMNGKMVWLVLRQFRPSRARSLKYVHCQACQLYVT